MKTIDRKIRKGFTLVELLVVIAIIGILSSIVLASLNGARMKARDGRRISDIKQIQLALEMYYEANGTYPTTISNLGSYLSIIPTDPLSNTAYLYAGLGSGAICTKYHLGATLETSNPVLLEDADASVSSPVCTGGTDFDGTPPLLYDLKPY